MKKTRFQFGIQERVALIIFFTTVVTGAAVFEAVYVSAYQAMIDNFITRSSKVYEHAGRTVGPDSFALLETREDQDRDAYREAQAELNLLRSVADVRYLYTAKYNWEGQLIYLIDGLDAAAEDIRHVGDPIEPEIREDLSRCLAGEIRHSERIMETEWGPVFVSFWPVRDTANQVVGAIGMEFDAAAQYEAFQRIRNRSLALSCAVFLVLAMIGCSLFRRVSEPYFKKLAYTDYVTGLGNRLAFEQEQDSVQRIVPDIPVCVAVFDLNNLKQVNDIHGHAMGDRYIKKAAEQLRLAFDGLGSIYRIGGDEFAAILVNPGEPALEMALAKLETAVQAIDLGEDMPLSIAYGLSWCSRETEQSLHSAFVRADAAMYSNKNQLKQQKNGSGRLMTRRSLED